MPPDQALSQNARRSQDSGAASPEEARARYAQDQQSANDSVLRDVQGRGGGDVVQKKTGGKASASGGDAARGPMNSDLSPHKKGPVSGDVSPATAAEFGQDVASHATEPVQKKRAVVQQKSVAGGGEEKDKAAAGVRGRAEKLPYKDQIQKSFGKHKLGDIKVFKDKGAQDAAKEIGAKAYAMGDKIAFGGGADLHTAAHEAAHVVQQRAGITGGGKWETHADKVADAVVAGEDAEPLLDEVNGGANPDKYFGQGDGAVQKKATDKGKQFLGSGYFKQQANKDTFKADLKSGVEGEIKEDEAKLPEVEEKMGPEAQEQPADGETEAPGDPGEPTDGVEGADPDAPPEPVPQDVDAPPQPPAPNIAAGKGDDIEQAKKDFKGSVRSMPSKVDNLKTSPGPAPKVALAGKSDPTRSDRQDEDTTAKSDKALLEAKAKIDSGPGAEQVVPKVVKETHKIELPEAKEMDGLADIPKATKFTEMSTVKQDIKDKTDEVGQAQLKASVSKAEGDLDKAQSKRVADRDKEIANAEKKNKELVDQANKDQDAEVKKQRSSIDSEQKATKAKQDKEVAAVKNKSKSEKAKLKSDIDGKVKESEKGIETEFKNAEDSAAKEKKAAEKKAADKKKEAEKESENDSWWSRATSAIASAFDAIAGAITAILDAVVEAVNKIVDLAKKAANALIDLAVKFVSAAIEAYGEMLKGLVNGLLGDLFPGLAKALTEFIDKAVDLAKKAVAAVGEALKKGIAALLDAAAGFLKGIIAAYKAAIEAALALAKAVLTGDWEALGKMILEGVLKLAGIPPAAFYAVMDQAMGAIDTIIEDPGGFVGNVIDAAAGGFDQFSSNILTHLKDGFFEWIVGPIGEMGLTLPTTWDFKGVFGLAAQVLGLTQDGIKKVVTEELGETAGVIFEYVWKYVGALIEGGIEGLWEQVKQDLSSLYEMVIDGIKSWIIETIVKQAVLKIATMFNPAGALLNAIIAVWNVYEFLRDQVSRIFSVVQSVVDTVAQIAAGNTQPAKDGVEKALASLIPIAIDLLAKLLGLGGITKKVKEIIEGVQEKVHGAIRKLIRKVKGLFGGGKDEEKADDVSYADLSFSAPTGEGGATEQHRIFAKDAGGSPQVMIASDEKPAAQQTSDSGEFKQLTDEQTAQVNALTREAEGLYKAAKDQGKPELDQQADQKMQAAKAILASIAAANVAMVKEKYATQLALMHSTTSASVDPAIEAKLDVITQANDDWSKTKAAMGEHATLKSFVDKPGSSHEFGDYVVDSIAVPQLEAAMSDVGMSLTDIGESSHKDWVKKRKGAISGGQGRYATPKAKLQETVWDKTNETEAVAQFKATFKSNLTETKKVHNKYKPKGDPTAHVENEDGDWVFKYGGFDGAEFTVTKSPGEQGMVKSITGANLTLKGTQPADVVGRGALTRTGNRNTTDKKGTPEEEKLYLEASHLIADRFRGTGYKDGSNLVTTSAHYNDPVMKEVEDKIAQAAEGGERMTITVSVEWMEYKASAVVKQLVRDRAAEIGADLTDATEAEALKDLVEKQLDERFARMSTDNYKRVKKVTYAAEITQADGKLKTVNKTIRADKWA